MSFKVYVLRRYMPQFGFGLFDGSVYKKVAEAKYTYVYCSIMLYCHCAIFLKVWKTEGVGSTKSITNYCYKFPMKDTKLCLVGPPDSGKTSWLSPFEGKPIYLLTFPLYLRKRYV